MLAPNNPLRKPGYRALTIFAALGAMGGGFHFIASYWILYGETGSSTSVAWLIISYFLPAVVVMPAAGVLVDRVNRRWILLASSLYTAALNLGLAGLLATGLFRTEYLFGYAILATVGNSISWTAFFAWMKDALEPEELVHANGLNTVLFQGGYLAGSGLAGVLYPTIGGTGSFLVDALATGAWALYWLRAPRWFPDPPAAVLPAGQARTGPVRAYLDGMRYVSANLLLFLFALLTIAPRLAAQLVNVLLVGFSGTVLGGDSRVFGYLDMSYGIGAMFCGLSFPWFLERTRARTSLPFLSLVLAAAACLGLSAATGLAGAILCLIVLGATVHVVSILASTTMQREVGREVIGRVSSTVHICQYLFIPPIVWFLGRHASGASGRILHASPIRDAFVVCAVLFLAFAAAAHAVTRAYDRSRARPRPVAVPVAVPLE